MSKRRKLNLYTAVIVSLLIVSMGVVRIIDMRENHTLNLDIAEACMDEGGTVVSVQDHIFSLSEVSCE
ncbi:hypothetical protein [Bacillus sinesaloumensis]|uniref:hypothetical protein n=1 Tax=Litchfieldia sinesaloumensis TaxID=1926280 RepID=UPI0009887571|nr:hypothetical protein [Bacillus sinesaloumensis]